MHFPRRDDILCPLRRPLLAAAREGTMRERRTLAGAVAAALMLSSCIGMDSRATFRSDGSGTLRIEYRVAKSLWDLGREGGSQGGRLPVVADEQELREALSRGKGLHVVAVSRREDAKDVFVAAEVRFERVEAFAETDAFADMPMSLERSGDDFVFRQAIAAAEDGQSTVGRGMAAGDSYQELKEMFGHLLEGYEVVLSVAAPRPLKSYSAGELSGDRKSVTLRLPLESLAEIPKGTVFTVTW